MTGGFEPFLSMQCVDPNPHPHSAPVPASCRPAVRCPCGHLHALAELPGAVQPPRPAEKAAWKSVRPWKQTADLVLYTVNIP